MKSYLEQTIESICESIRFPSVQAPSQKDAPFGEDTKKCLDHFLTLANTLGFETKNYDGYAGEVVFGEGEEFAILAHLDVVPAGDGWTKAPFGGEIAEGKIWGRGATDDKGPAICCLYALKILKDEGFIPSKKIKLIVGCNEESGWKCIDYYKKNAALPEVGFSPDADFPVIYAEKGIAHLRLHFPTQNPPFARLVGGTSANMVCDFCEARPLSFHKERIKKYRLKRQGTKLLSFGKSAHGSTPERGKNAMKNLLKYFAPECKEAQTILEYLFEDSFHLKRLKDETGKLTLSPDIIQYRKGEIQVLCDIRYPATMTLERVLKKVHKMGVKYEVVHHQPPLFHDKRDEMIRTLLEVYQAHTGEEVEPIAIGGGTYARALKRGVGFGPEMAGEDCHIHQPDEFISLDRVELLLEIYKNAIERLTK